MTVNDVIPAKAGIQWLLSVLFAFFLVKADPGLDLQAQCSVWDAEGYAHTAVVAGDGGSMTWICRPDENCAPPVPDGMRVLGSRYDTVWGYPTLKAVYDSVYPPGKDGRSRPFGVFAGMEKEMGL